MEAAEPTKRFTLLSRYSRKWVVAVLGYTLGGAIRETPAFAMRSLLD